MSRRQPDRAFRLRKGEAAADTPAAESVAAPDLSAHGYGQRILTGSQRALKNALLAGLAAFGLSVLLLTALFGQVYWSALIFAVGASVLAVCLLHALSPKIAAAVIAVAAIALMLGCLNIGPLAGAAQALRVFWVYPDILASALPPYRGILGLLVPAVLGVLCAVLVLIDTPTLTLLPMALFSIVFGTQLIGNTTAPALIGAGACTAAYLLALARERTRLTQWPLVIVCAAVALVFLFMPRAMPAAPALREAAEEVYQTVSDYLPSSDESARSGFTLETEGYLPLGSDARPRLGGPANPSNRKVMEVTTDHAVYLRGIAMNSYTGLNWEDTLSGRRYLYADLIQLGYRRNVFDEYLPLTSETLTLDTVSVHMLSAAATTLYLPQRLRSLETKSGHMTPYFNAGSEVFLPRELSAGDGYAATYLRLPADSALTARIVEEASAVSDTRYNEIVQVYTALPSHLQRELYDLSFTAAGGEETPYRRALAIRDYLRGHYAYDLNVQDPPANTDFAAWFLLRTKRGYCTYFATALTLLCRMQGIPARYVTGYLAIPEDGVATVTSEDAHAWTEIYLNGFGWLTLDATPGDHGEEPDEGDDPTPDGPEPTAPPEPTPTPEPPEPDGNETVDTPTPAPTFPPQATETPPDTPPGPTSPPLWVLLLILALAVTASFLAFCYLRDPERRANRHPRQAADILAAAVNAAFARLYRPRRKDETPMEYYAAAANLFPDLPLEDFGELYSAHLYGKKPMRADLPLRIWQEAQERLSFPQRLSILTARKQS